MKRIFALTVLAAFLGTAILSAHPVGAQATSSTFQIQDLGPMPGGSYSYAFAINDNGQVVGWGVTASGDQHAFLYDSTGMHDIGTLPDGSYSIALGINNNGQVVGYSTIASGNTHAFLYDSAGMHDVGTLPGGYFSAASGINNNGQVAGAWAGFDANGYSFEHALLYDSTGMYDLGTLPGGIFSSAYGINDNGQVVGWSFTASGYTRAFLYDSAGMHDLGTLPYTLPGGDSYASAINNNGQVVGYSFVGADVSGNGIAHAFLYDSAGMHDLGTLPGGSDSFALAINDNGQVVGYSDGVDAAGNYFSAHAFLYDSTGMHDLGTLPGGSYSLANGINNKGQVTGYSDGVDTAGNYFSAHAFLITSKTDTTAPTTTASSSGPAGSNGWYTGVVTVTLSATDPDDNPAGPGSDVAATYYTLDGGVQQTYSAPFTVSGDGQHTITYWSVDKAGNIETTNSQTLKIDSVAPFTSVNLSQQPNAAGWNNQNVSVSLRSSDSGSGVAQITYSASGAQGIPATTVSGASASVTISAEGTTTLSCYATDNAGNIEQANTLAIHLDKTAPVISASNVAATATSVNGATVSYSQPAVADNLSGVAGAVVCSPASGSQFALGTSPVTCSVSDNAGNQATKTFNVSVTYSWSGILQPINADGSSVFKLGSTIPVKFQLTGASAGITNAVANLSYQQIGTTSSSVNEAVSTSAADSGNQFRYDATSGQYIFNMSSKGMVSGGKYLLSIDLHDGVSRTVQIGIR